MISKQSLLVGKKYEILTINSDTPAQHPTIFIHSTYRIKFLFYVALSKKYDNFTQHEINRINVQLINMCVAKT